MPRGVLRHVLALVLLLAPLVGCHRGVRFEEQVFSKPGVRYHVGALPPGWERVKLSQDDLAWYTGRTGHALSVNATCGEYEDAPLDVLTRHLVMGFTERLEVEQHKVVLDEREALRTRYRAKLDGVPVELLLLVLKKNQCIYDFTYVAPLGRYEERLADFEALVRGFHTEGVS